MSCTSRARRPLQHQGLWRRNHRRQPQRQSVTEITQRCPIFLPAGILRVPSEGGRDAVYKVTAGLMLANSSAMGWQSGGRHNRPRRQALKCLARFAPLGSNWVFFFFFSLNLSSTGLRARQLASWHHCTTAVTRLRLIHSSRVFRARRLRGRND